MHIERNELKNRIKALTTAKCAQKLRGCKVRGHSQVQDVLKTISRVEAQQRPWEVLARELNAHEFDI